MRRISVAAMAKKCARLCQGTSRVGQTEVGLVDEGGGLQGVAGALAAQVGGGARAQFFVDDGDRPVEGLAAAVAPLL